MDVVFFNSDVAEKVGVPGAIILNNLKYWIKHNRENEQNCYDGEYWTYNSLKAFCEQMPFYSQSTISRTLSKLETGGYIKTGNYNRDRWDRTKWYALTPVGYDLVEKRQAGDTQNAKCTFSQNAKCTFSQNAKSTIEQINTNRDIHKDIATSEPFCTDEPQLNEALRAFAEMRKKIHAPLTERGERNIMRKLERLAPGDTDMKIAILDQSIERSWRGVFALHDDDRPPACRSQPQASKPREVAMAERVMAMLGDDDDDAQAGNS